MTTITELNQKKMQKVVAGLVFLMVLLIGLDLFVKRSAPVQNPPPEVTSPYVATLRGEFVCLPHRGGGEFETLECALGIKADDGNYYALDAQMISDPSLLNASTGTRIEVTGILVPIEFISSDFWSRYDIRGIISVSEWKKL